jgi:hypothetical protein
MGTKLIAAALGISVLILRAAISPAWASQTTISGVITLTLPTRLEMKTVAPTREAEAGGSLSEVSKKETLEENQKDEGSVQSEEKIVRQDETGARINVLYRTVCPK